jgi:hypothetical protein
VLPSTFCSQFTLSKGKEVCLDFNTHHETQLRPSYWGRFRPMPLKNGLCDPCIHWLNGSC